MFNMGAWRDYLERMRERDDKVWRVDLSADKQRIAALESQVAAERIAQLEADNAALRAALHEVEWDAHGHCPWCGVQMGKRHRPTCQRQSALGLSVKG